MTSIASLEYLKEYDLSKRKAKEAKQKYACTAEAMKRIVGNVQLQHHSTFAWVVMQEYLLPSPFIMAKIRGIKPEFWTDSKIVGLKIPTRLFFVGLWNFCDDQGVFVWNPLELKMRVFPADNFDTTSALRELVEASCVIEFEYNGKKYGLVSNFEKHQRPDKRFLVTLIEPQELAKIKPLVEVTTSTLRDHHDDIEGEGDIDIEGDIDTTTRSRSQAEFSEDSEEYKLSKLLYQNILSFNDRFKKPDLQKWCAEIDKMLRIDRRSVEEVETLILWVSQDSFWKANILSTRKLREKFDQLWSKAVANQQSKARTHLIIN